MLSKRMDQWEENIRQEGRQEERKEGRKRQLAMLTKIIERRGSAVSAQMKEHLAQLNEDELLVCLDKILNNEPLEEFLEG